MKKLNTIILATLLVTPLAATANGFYIGTQVGYGEQKNQLTDILNSSDKDLETAVGALKVGYDFNDYIGTEVRLSGTNTHTSETYSKYQTSAYLKGMVPISESFSLYGLVGATSAKMDTNVHDKKHLNSMSYGIGARYAVTEKVGLNLELNQISSHKDYELSALTIGVDYKF